MRNQIEVSFQKYVTFFSQFDATEQIRLPFTMRCDDVKLCDSLPYRASIIGLCEPRAS